ncbi:MAG: S1C family serine protease [Candidatus Komeilibacteria bacterium]|nr:S1C family serine protease [Candidatus Komeilibacteria bacterium]
MKKQVILFLIIAFIFSVVPFNFSFAITQNQISSEVQIVCPDNYGNWFSGSGTIIDPKGIILTNKHVVTDEKNAIIKTCFIGFMISINQEPDFGTKDNPNLAEVKYYTTSDDMDAAILYLNNTANQSYPYINIWDSNSNSLKFGDKIEAIGFPSIGGSTITYTSGDFSGFGSSSDGTQNFIKTTIPLEHGNSGGAAYNPSGQFVGIPTMVVAGTLNSLSYVLSINSIKNWLSGILGNQYKQEIIEEKPIIENKSIYLKDDKTPPSITYKGAPRDIFWYNAFDESGNKIQSGGNYSGSYKLEGMWDNNGYRKIQIVITSVGNILDKIDMDSGVYSAYYTYSNDINSLKNTFGTEYILTNDNSNKLGSDYWAYNNYITPILTLPDNEDVYYIGLRLKDRAGNVSNQYILTYVYEKNNYLGLKNLKFYNDSGYKNMVGNYDFTMTSQGWVYPRYHQYCATKLKNVYVKWEYEKNYSEYNIKYYDKFINEMGAWESAIEGGITTTNSNKYSVISLDKGGQKSASYEGNEPKTNIYYGDKVCYGNDCSLTGKVSSLLLKPYTQKGDPVLEGLNTVVKFIYNPDLSFNFMCGTNDDRGVPKYTLTKSKSLVEDSLIFDDNQKKIAEENTKKSALPSTAPIINNTLINKLKGYILLQVESAGEAWYVNPADGKRYYMKDGAIAYQMMRKFGLGITNANLAKIPQENEKNNYPSLVNKLKGKILLQVQSHGEAWYIHPKTGYRYYLKDGDAAYSLMRNYSLGITNKDLEKIPEGSL